MAMMATAGVLLVEAAGLGPWYQAPFKVCWSLGEDLRAHRAAAEHMASG